MRRNGAFSGYITNIWNPAYKRLCHIVGAFTSIYVLMVWIRSHKMTTIITLAVMGNMTRIALIKTDIHKQIVLKHIFKNLNIIF